MQTKIEQLDEVFRLLQAVSDQLGYMADIKQKKGRIKQELRARNLLCAVYNNLYALQIQILQETKKGTYENLWHTFKRELEYIEKETPDKVFAKHLNEVLLLAEVYQTMIVENKDVPDNT